MARILTDARKVRGVPHIAKRAVASVVSGWCLRIHAGAIDSIGGAVAGIIPATVEVCTIRTKHSRQHHLAGQLARPRVCQQTVLNHIGLKTMCRFCTNGKLLVQQSEDLALAGGVLNTHNSLPWQGRNAR